MSDGPTTTETAIDMAGRCVEGWEAADAAGKETRPLL
jgi:hypothetical protein